MKKQILISLIAILTIFSSCTKSNVNAQHTINQVGTVVLPNGISVPYIIESYEIDQPNFARVSIEINAIGLTFSGPYALQVSSNMPGTIMQMQGNNISYPTPLIYLTSNQKTVYTIDFQASFQGQSFNPSSIALEEVNLNFLNQE